MDAGSRSEVDSPATAGQFAWKEYRLLLYSGLVGVAGGLAAQIFVWLLNLAERLFLMGLAGYKPPEPGILNPVSVVGPWGLADSGCNDDRRAAVRNTSLYFCP